MTITPPNKLICSLYQRFLWRLMGRMVLLLTTIGRKSGKPHTIPLQYEKVDGKYIIGAAGGLSSDWFRNLIKTPGVQVRVGNRLVNGTAEAITDNKRIADFLEYRLKTHPVMIRLILRLDHIKGPVNRTSLERYAAKLGMAVITPQ